MANKRHIPADQNHERIFRLPTFILKLTHEKKCGKSYSLPGSGVSLNNPANTEPNYSYYRYNPGC